MSRRLLVPLLALLVPAAAAAQSAPIRLDEAIRRALEYSPDLKMGVHDVRKAEAEKMSALGRMGPIFTFEANVQRWWKGSEIKFDLPKSLTDLLGNLPGVDPATLAFPPMVVQDKTTSSTVLQVAQPLTPLWSLHSLWRVNAAALEGARLSQDATRETVRYKVAEAFFRVISAQKMAEVARMGVEQVEAHLKTARHFHEAGVVGKDDVLRAETALARVKDQQNQALMGVALSRAALNMYLGLPLDAPTQPVGDYPDDPPAPKLTEAQCQDRALQARPELGLTRTRVDMASAGREAAIGAMLPTISAVGRFAHQTGSKFQVADNMFVGGFLTWNFWEWGSTYHKIKSAEADRDKATEALQLVRDGIAIDVKKAWLELQQARSSIDANRTAIAAAEEALRVVTKKYEAATATSVEILDAQSALTQARAAYQVAVFGYYTSLANLERAVGGTL